MTRLDSAQGFAHHYCLFRSVGTVLAMHGGALGLVSFMSPGQALVEIHPSRRRGFDDYVHAAVSLGVTYRAVYARGAWKGLGTASGAVPVGEVVAAVHAATASAPRDRSQLEDMVRRSV